MPEKLSIIYIDIRRLPKFHRFRTSVKEIYAMIPLKFHLSVTRIDIKKVMHLSKYFIKKHLN